MYVSKLSIQNYRNFGNKAFEIELTPFTLIIGENNIGKTNLLNAIGLILSPDISFFQKRILDVEDINYQTVNEFKESILSETDFAKIIFPKVKVEIILTDFTADQHAVAGDWHIKEENNSQIGKFAKLSFVYEPHRVGDLEKWFDETQENLKRISIDDIVPTVDNIDFPIQHYQYTIFGGDNETKRIDFNWLNFFRMEFLDALRDAKVHLSAGGKNTLLFNILNSQTQNKILSLKSNLLKLKELVKEEGSVFTTIQKEIEKYLKKISGEEDDDLINFQFSGLETSEILKRMGLLYGSEPISIERNGLGRNNLLYISLLLSQLLKDADKKKVYFRMIGIEEPEAHLHPLLQIHLSRNIDIDKSKERQVLITSHSTHITSQLSLEETIVLYKDAGEIKPYYLLKNLPKASKRYLQKYLDATKSTMFFARKIILVEGISEQLVIPEFFKLYTGETLEKKNISIVNVDSVAFEHFLTVIKNGYFVKCLVLTDSDSDKQTKHRVPTLKRAYSSISQINIVESLQTTYEKDLIIENTTDKGKDILLETLIRTRRNNGKKLKDSLGDSPITDVETFFINIYKENALGKAAENHKAAFAMNLVDVLQDEKFKDKINGFNIPKYIKDGFEFLIKKNE